MGKKGKNKRIGVVYSTNDDYEYQHESDWEEESLPVSEQNLTVHREKQGRGGKTVIIIRGFIGNQEDLNELGKTIKKKVGTGGSAKDGEIVIQGDCRPKVMDILQQEGYKAKQVGG